MNLFAELILHMSFNTPKHERLQNHVQPPQLMFIKLTSFVLGRILDILGEPLIEFVVRIKETWHNEVQKGPQL